MKFFIIFATFFLAATQIPKNDPNGIWQAETGSKFNLRLTADDLKVSIVEGSNPRYLKYDVSLKNTGEINTYKGTGSFVAKLENGKECRFETEWHIVVVSPERILGVGSSIIPDPATCEIKERSQLQIDLKRTQ